VHALFCNKTQGEIAKKTLSALCADLQQRVNQHHQVSNLMICAKMLTKLSQPAFCQPNPNLAKDAIGLFNGSRVTLPDHANMELAIHECTQPRLKTFPYYAVRTKIYISILFTSL
jgi:hypothetical protein